MTLQVAVRELKAQLSRILARARAGEVVEVRSRNVPIARITGIPEGAGGALQALITAGAVSWSGRKATLPTPAQLEDGGKPVSTMVIEDRR